MDYVRIKSKVLHAVDLMKMDYRDKFPAFTLDRAKLESDMKRAQYAHGEKWEAEEICKGDLVLLSCTSAHPHYQKKDIYVIVGKNLYSQELEEKLVGMTLGTHTVTVEEQEVIVLVQHITRTAIPALTDENVRTWGMAGVSTVEELKRFYFGRQVDHFRDDDEEADMALSRCAMAVLDACEIACDEEELQAIRISTKRNMNHSFGEQEEAFFDLEDGRDPGLAEETEETDVDMDVDTLIETMTIGSLQAAALGYRLLEEQGKLYTYADYQQALSKRAIMLGLTKEEAKEVFSEMDYAIEYYGEYYFNLMDQVIGDAMKAHYYKQNNKPDVYDVAIIGAGPAGLSAALTLNLHGKSILWFGTDTLSDKVEKSEKIANYAGFLPGSGKALNTTFREQIHDAGLELTDKMVTQISKYNDGFMVLADNEIYKAKTILMTIGSVPAKGIEQEQELLGKGVSYCATCDGFLYKGKEIAVFCGAKRYEHEVSYLAELADKVYLQAAYEDVEIDLPNVELLSKPMGRILGEERVTGIQLKDGTEIPVAGAFFLRKSVAPATIISGLEMNGAHIVVNRACETNISGCFAAGDCTGRPYQIAKAVGEGNVAAHSIVNYLAEVL